MFDLSNLEPSLCIQVISCNALRCQWARSRPPQISLQKWSSIKSGWVFAYKKGKSMCPYHTSNIYIYKIHVTVFIPKHSTILSASPGFVIVFCIFSMIRTETWKSWAENSALRTRTPELGTRQPYIHSARLSSRVSSSDIKASSSPAGLKASSARHRSRVKHRSCLHRPRTFQIHFSRSKVPSLMLPTWIILLPISSTFRSGTVVLKKNPWKLKLLIVTSFFKNGCYCSGSIKCGCTTFADV